MSIKLTAVKPYSLFFQALANPARMRILDLLRERGRMSVSEIYGELRIEQTHASHSLRCLSFCGLVRATQEGRSRYYSLNEETVRPLLRIVDGHLRTYATKLFNCDVLER